MERKNLIEVLKNRFIENKELHPNISFNDVEKLLTKDKLEVIYNMELLGGKPDLINYNGQYMYVDTLKETTEDRSNITYDQKAEDQRVKEKLPIKGNALAIVERINADLLSEAEYIYLQSLADFDLKTSVWLKTPDSVRSKGGALFGDKRYGRAFIYHNGAKSFYKVRGFRAKINL